MAIEMNFGWLNDYTGSKFAPVTLANLVLLDTSSGSTETLFDFIESENKVMKENLIKHDKEINDNIRTLTRLTHIVPIDMDDSENEMPPLAAQRAVRLVTASSTGDCSWDDAENHEIGIEVGSLNRPVFFTKGVPERCYEGRLGSVNVIYEDILSGQMIEVSMPDFGITDGRQPYALDANISGISQYSKEAHSAVTSQFASTSKTSQEALKAKALTYNIQAGLNSETGETGVGDIDGIIYTSNDENVLSGIKGVALSLRDIPDLDTKNSYGGKTQDLESLTAFRVPKLTVDQKGRITSIVNEIINPQVVITPIDQVTSGTTAALVGYMGAADNPNAPPSLVGSTTDAERGIYMDWTDPDSPPVLMGAAWNDYAEYRTQKEKIEPGYCVKSNDDGRVEYTDKKLCICDGIVSDTFGFSIGKNKDAQTPLAVSGRVLAYYEGNREDYHAGDVVCASVNGKIAKMTREEIRDWPDRIIGIVSEIPTYEYWNTIKINNRIWIKVK